MTDVSPTRMIRAAAPLRQQVVEEIRRRILDGTYAPGQRLIERVLCEDLEVSRTVVREALRQLESEHLILLVPNVGPIVRTLTPDEVRSLYEVRALLESEAARLAARRRTEVLVGELDVALDRIHALTPDQIGDLLAAKDAFSDVVVLGSGNTVIGDMLRSVHARISQLRAMTLREPGRIEHTLRELRTVRDAIADGDGPRAASAALAHVESAAAIAIRNIEAMLDG